MDVCKLAHCYSYEPLPAALSESEGKHVLGSQVTLWSEYVRNSKELEYAMFPRLCALSEVFWSTLEGRNFEDFKNRLQGHVKLLASERVAYCDKDV